MYAIPQESDPHRFLEKAPQEALNRAFVLTGLRYSEQLAQFDRHELGRLADAAREFMVMGANWNRPDPA